MLRKVSTFVASALQTVSLLFLQFGSKSLAGAVQLNCLIGHRKVNNHSSANVHKYRANLHIHAPIDLSRNRHIRVYYQKWIRLHIFFLEKGNNCKSMLKKLLNALFVYYMHRLSSLSNFRIRLMHKLKTEVLYLRRGCWERRCNLSESNVNICQCENCLKWLSAVITFWQCFSSSCWTCRLTLQWYRDTDTLPEFQPRPPLAESLGGKEWHRGRRLKFRQTDRSNVNGR